MVNTPAFWRLTAISHWQAEIGTAESWSTWSGSWPSPKRCREIYQLLGLNWNSLENSGNLWISLLLIAPTKQDVLYVVSERFLHVADWTTGAVRRKRRRSRSSRTRRKERRRRRRDASRSRSRSLCLSRVPVHPLTSRMFLQKTIWSSSCKVKPSTASAVPAEAISIAIHSLNWSYVCVIALAFLAVGFSEFLESFCSCL